MSKENFELHEDEIVGVRKDQQKKSGMPMSIYIGEAETLVKVIADDVDILMDAGMTIEMINKLATLVGALRYVQSKCNAVHNLTTSSQKIWDENEVDAVDLKIECIRALRYAFRKEPDLLQRVDSIEDGTGQPDLIQDLNDLSILGLENFEYIAAINYPRERIEEAGALSDRMGELYGQKESTAEKSERKQLRDQTFALLKELVDELYACGQYVHHGNKDRQQKHRSEYLRRKNQRDYQSREKNNGE